MEERSAGSNHQNGKEIAGVRMSNQTTVIQLWLEVPPNIDFDNGSIVDYKTYTKDEMLHIMNGEVSMDTLCANGLCCRSLEADLQSIKACI
jgi:hypothetical protein